MKHVLKLKGFTLIEIMVVIAIIGVLVGIVIAGATKARSAARDSQRQSDLKVVQLRLEQYRLNVSTYPKQLTALAPTYMATVPTDPVTKAVYSYTPTPSTCAGTVSSKCTSYTIQATLENAKNGSLIYSLNSPSASSTSSL